MRLRGPHYYILNDDHSVTGVQVRDPVTDEINRASLFAWADAWEGSRFVAREEFEDGSYVSTIFLGLDHSFFDGPPVLFETMAFTGAKKPNPLTGREHPEELRHRRYCTWDEAMAGHADAVAEHRAIVDQIRLMQDTHHPIEGEEDGKGI